jgi:hypothetical protein
MNEVQKRAKKEQNAMEGRKNSKGKEEELKQDNPAGKELSEVRTGDTEGAETLR